MQNIPFSPIIIKKVFYSQKYFVKIVYFAILDEFSLLCKRVSVRASAGHAQVEISKKPFSSKIKVRV